MPQTDVWGAVFSCAPANTQAIILGMAEVYSLLEACKRDAQALERQRELCLQTLETIQTGLARFSLHEHIQAVIGQWTESTITSMRFVEEAIRPAQQLDRADVDDIADLAKQIDVFEATLQDSNIERRTKLLLLDIVAKLRLAMNAYRVMGSQYAQRVVAEGLGVLYLTKAEVKKAPNVFDQFISVMATTTKVFRGFKAGAAAIESATDAYEKIKGLLE